MFGKRQSGNGVIHTLIGDGTEIKGDLYFDGGCHIDGVIHGNVIADKDPDAFLNISEDGFVDGNVRVPRVSLNGKVQGDVYATQTVALGATAKVVGNLHYDLLEMTSGAEINGKLIHEGTKAQAAAKQARSSAPESGRAQSVPGIEPAKTA